MNILIAGLTGSGKNLLSMRLAEVLKKKFQLEAEIVNADSVQIYRDLKIIANHPTKSDFFALPHHLYEILAPYENSSAAFWVEKAREIIRKLNAENKIAIICGGTGFYIDALLHDISEIPTIPKEIRETVRLRYEKIGHEKFFDELRALDPVLTEKLHPNNTQRILRAYEVVLHTGKPLSEWWKNSKNFNALYKKEESNINSETISSFVLIPERSLLKNIIVERTKKMIASGAVEEIEEFIKNFPNYSGPLQKVIGFPEIKSMLNGEINSADCVEKIITKTMQYAKRQSTWFRHQLPEAKILQTFGYNEDLLTSISYIALMRSARKS